MAIGVGSSMNYSDSFTMLVVVVSATEVSIVVV